MHLYEPNQANSSEIEKSKRRYRGGIEPGDLHVNYLPQLVSFFCINLQMEGQFIVVFLRPTLISSFWMGHTYTVTMLSVLSSGDHQFKMNNIMAFSEEAKKIIMTCLTHLQLIYSIIHGRTETYFFPHHRGSGNKQTSEARIPDTFLYLPVKPVACEPSYILFKSERRYGDIRLISLLQKKPYTACSIKK